MQGAKQSVMSLPGLQALRPCIHHTGGLFLFIPAQPEKVEVSMSNDVNIDIEIENRVVDVFEAAGFPLDRMDVGITLMKMSRAQQADLIAMIDYLTQHGKKPSFIAAQVGHDLNGLAVEFINGPSGFSPRSHGYAKKVG